MTTESKTLPVLQTNTHVRGARKDDDAQGLDGAVKRSRHVTRQLYDGFDIFMAYPALWFVLGAKAGRGS